MSPILPAPMPRDRDRPDGPSRGIATERLPTPTDSGLDDVVAKRAIHDDLAPDLLADPEADLALDCPDDMPRLGLLMWRGGVLVLRRGRKR